MTETTRKLAPRAQDFQGREPQTDLAVAPQVGGMIDVASSRAAQEVQAAMVVAKRFPRDHEQSYNRIIHACRRPALAEVALYTYPRGGTRVEGPSIRMAEMLAQNWGNVDFGIVELEQRDGESIMMAYCWDLEVNTRQTRIFTVKHERHTKRGITHLTDPRDIYEMTANQGARRVRACILGVIPGDVVESALVECNRTLQGKSDLPLADRLRTMVVAFADLGVTQEMIVARLGHKLDAVTESELVGLRKIFASIRDEMSTPADWFGASTDQAGADGLADRLAGAGPTEDDPATKAEAARQVEALKGADTPPADAPEEAPETDGTLL